MGDQNRRRRYVTVFVAVWLLAGCALYTTALTVDTDPSSANTLAVDAFDPKLTEIGPTTQNGTVDETKVDTLHDTWEDYSHTNGTVDPVNNTIRINNSATFAVDRTNISVTVVQNDSSLQDAIDDSSATAATIVLLEFTYNGTDLLPSISDHNGNNQTDLDDLATANLTGLEGIPTDGTVDLHLSIAGDSSTNDNIAGGDGIDFTLRLELAVGSWRDYDESTTNTIQYGT